MLVLHLWRNQSLSQSFPMHRCIYSTGWKTEENDTQLEIGFGIAAKRRNVPRDMRQKWKRRIIFCQGWFLRFTWGSCQWTTTSFGKDIPFRFKLQHPYYFLSLGKLLVEFAF